MNLNLGLRDPDGDNEGDLSMGERGEAIATGADLEMKDGKNLETGSRLKRKAITPDLEMRM